MESTPNDDLSLESTVIMALIRIQKEKSDSKKKRLCEGVLSKEIVEYLKANCSWVDGDIESQVMTTLLSCVKAGLVCSLGCGKYSPVEMKSKNMMTNCETRVCHGPKCNCLKTLECMVKTFRRPCCIMKTTLPELKKGKKLGKKSKNCVMKAEEKFDSDTSKMLLRGVKRCNYCLQFHPPPKSKNVCVNCNCLKTASTVPEDKFSPRDESSSERFSESWK